MLYDLTGGIGVGFGDLNTSRILSRVATRQPYAVDVTRGTAISADADTTISLANGTTYRVTMTTTTTRTISLPTASVQAGERVWLQFHGADTTAGKITVAELAGPSLIDTQVGSGIDAGASFLWTGSEWYPLMWSQGLGVLK